MGYHLNGTYHGVVRVRNLITVAFEPEETMVGKTVIGNNGCMYPERKGVITGYRLDWLMGPRAEVKLEDGTTEWVGCFLPAESRAIGYRFEE
jgi:hypothetical protein